MGGDTVNRADEHSSTSSTLGADEKITFTPSVSANYAIVAIRRSGTGIATLSVDEVPLLTSDTVINETYTTVDKKYYYETYSMIPGNYHLIWLGTDYITDPDLYLYSDPLYSTQIGYSTFGSQVEWIVYHPSISQSTYPMAIPDSGVGNAYIEAEIGFNS